jgi:hypothetical protein
LRGLRSLPPTAPRDFVGLWRAQDIHSTVSAPDRGGDDDQGDEPIYFFEFVRVNEP